MLALLVVVCDFAAVATVSASRQPDPIGQDGTPRRTVGPRSLNGWSSVSRPTQVRAVRAVTVAYKDLIPTVPIRRGEGHAPSRLRVDAQPSQA
jgi:hypothetical protein